MGRPRKFSDGILSKHVTIYFTDAQFDDVRDLATLRGTSVNKFIAGEVLKVVAEHSDDIAKIRAAKKLAAKLSGAIAVPKE